MKEITTIEQLKEVALDIDKVGQHLEKMYNIKNGKLAFITNGTKYLILYTTGIEDLLEMEGFVRHKGIYVPFAKRKDWEKLKKMFKN